jgi:hypothetical protein
MAPFGHGPMSDLSPLSGEERKSNFGPSGPLMRPLTDLGSSPLISGMLISDRIRISDATASARRPDGCFTHPTR